MSEVDEQIARSHVAREALVGKTVAGKWVLRSLIGHGGMGAVYEAENEQIGKRVAIKFVDPEFATDEQVVARFAREARAMSSIESAHIVTVFDAGTEDGRPYLVMELLRGEDLGKRLRRTRTVPLGEALHIIAQVLKGLARAHAAGIVHRDLKPDNVFLAAVDHDPLFAKIVDFGVSKIDRPRASTMPMALTGRGTVLGTPLYMSPEQAQCSADVDARADLYSVGAILFECLTGRPPHVGETYEQVILSICMSDAPDVRTIDASVPPDVAAFLKRSLARDRDARFATAQEMLAALLAMSPSEKARITPENPLVSTLASAGVKALKPTKERAIVVEEAKPAKSGKATKAKDAEEKATRGPTVTYATAVIAGLAGVGLVVGIILARDRARDAEPLPIPTPSVTVASHTEARPAPAASSVAPESSAPAPSASAASSASSGVAPVESASIKLAPKPLPSATPRPPASTAPKPSASAGTKPLDIQRDLPP